jgi:hypothetical protein
LKVAALQKTLAKIRLFGPRSREDLVTLFAVQNGMITIPDGALHRPEKWWGDADTSLHGEYKRGLLNLKRVANVVMPPADPQARQDPLNFPVGQYQNAPEFRMSGAGSGGNALDMLGSFGWATNNGRTILGPDSRPSRVFNGFLQQG